MRLTNLHKEVLATLKNQRWTLIKINMERSVIGDPETPLWKPYEIIRAILFGQKYTENCFL